MLPVAAKSVYVAVADGLPDNSSGWLLSIAQRCRRESQAGGMASCGSLRQDWLGLTATAGARQSASHGKRYN
jgi:hypothetical protein